MTVYIVLEEDRGIGVMVSGVYPTEAQAQASCGSHNWVAEALFDDAEIRKECASRAKKWFGEHPNKWGVRVENDEATAWVNLTDLCAAIEGEGK